LAACKTERRKTMERRVVVCQTGKNPCDIPKESCSLAMAYVPWQTWETMYNEEQALEIGTVFPSLDKPFLGRGIHKCMKEKEC